MADDLSKQHTPVSSLFTQPATAEEWARYRLSEAQLEFYAQHGYLAGIQVLNDEQIEALRGELAELVEPNHDGSELWHEYHSNESGDPNAILFHALGAWRIRPAMHDLLWNPAFLMPASQLLGGAAVRFWHDQLFCKPAHDGGVVAWHQDYSYWQRTKPMGHLTCWMGLDDSTIENGCLQYVPGSHRWELLPRTDLANDMEAIKQVLTDEQKAMFQPVAIELKAGQCAFHHPMILHGSYANRSERPRRAVVTNVFKDGTLSDSDEPMLVGADAIAKGQPMGGQFWPLLYDGRA